MGFFGDAINSIGGAVTAPFRVPAKLLKGEKVDAGDWGGFLGGVAGGPGGSITGAIGGNVIDKVQQDADNLERELAAVNNPEYKSGGLNDATLGAIRARQDRAMRDTSDFENDLGGINKGLIQTPTNLQPQVAGGANIPGLSQVISQRQNEAAQRMNQSLMAKNKLEAIQNQGSEIGSLGNMANTLAKMNLNERIAKEQADFNRDLKVKQMIQQRDALRTQVITGLIGGVAQLGGIAGGFAIGGPAGAGIGAAMGGAANKSLNGGG